LKKLSINSLKTGYKLQLEYLPKAFTIWPQITNFEIKEGGAG